jgi:TetR/AcrR family transcriptional repressor of nem operon
MAQTENPVIEVAPGRLTARGAATRARIVDAAADLMYAQGALRTSLDEVMAASRTSKSQLYHYFHDKDALIRAVIVRQTERVLDGQHPYLCALDSMTGLRRWCTMIIDVQQQRSGVGGCPIGSLASELSDTSEDARQLLADSFQKWEARLETGLQAMQHTGELQADADPADLASAIMAALQGGLLLTQTTRATRHLQLSLNMALHHIAHHLRDPHHAIPTAAASGSRPRSAAAPG